MIGAGTAQDFTITKTPFGAANATQAPIPWAFPLSASGQPLQNLNRNRFYRPDIGRFLSSDPLTVLPLGWYTYVYNSPIGLVDPYGRAPEGCTPVGPPVPKYLYTFWQYTDKKMDFEAHEEGYEETGLYILWCKWTWTWYQREAERWQSKQKYKCCTDCRHCWDMWENYGDPYDVALTVWERKSLTRQRQKTQPNPFLGDYEDICDKGHPPAY